MKKYKFLFDPQNGSYQGLVREPFPDNCTSVHPHFSLGFKTCWDFNGRWVLIREEKFFAEMSKQDILREYDLKTLAALSNNRMLMRVDRELLCGEMQKQRDYLAGVIRDYHTLSWGADRTIEKVLIDRLDSIELRVCDLQKDSIIILDQLAHIYDVVTMAKLKRCLRAKLQKLLRLLKLPRD